MVGPKAELVVAGVPMWERARDVLLGGGAESVIVVGPMTGAVVGGLRRRDSVGAGLAVLPDSARLVLIHDAARPLATADLVRSVAARLQVGDAAAVIPVVKVRDTIKRVAGEVVCETIDREGLFFAQTPQGFDLAALRAAHAASADDATDDAVLVERLGGLVVTVPGDPGNLKVTFQGDMDLVEELAR